MKVMIGDEVREVDADVMKLARTMFNKEGDKYTEEEMWEMGFELK